MASSPLFTLGIEEEYHLVDRSSRDLAIEPPAALMQRCKAQLAEQVSPEFLKAQIEVGTRVRDTLGQARADLALLRRTVADLAGEYDLAPIAAATHPFAQWNVQKPSEGPRYSVLARDLQMVGRRLVICGMHVHIGIQDPDLRIDLMNQASYFLPHLLALSASSPFWRGADTGLKSFRLSVFNGLPRTGLPERFDSWGEYQRHVRTLIEAGLIEDASNLWWDLRPSAHFPTLELRITDIPTRLDDTIALAALFRCLLRMLWRLRRANQRWRLYPHMLINENRWRAQRYGTEEGLVDFGRGQMVPMADLVEELLEELREDAEYFGCHAELARLRAIVAGGTSADRQRRIYRQALAQGVSDHDALCAVVDHLIAETIDNLDTS